MTRTNLAAVIALAALAACSHEKKAVTSKPSAKPTDTATQEAPKTPAVTHDTQVSPGLAISGDLAAACGIKVPAAGPAPKFDYDKDELTTEDRAVLDQLATCLTTGPLKGKALALIGRADPRGTEEYNLGLGSRRAESVSSYLNRLGVGRPQLAVTTRGALEATGTDEAGYAKDCRVDLQLKQD